MFTRLVHAIESHSDDIITALVNHIRHDPELKRLQALPDPELRQWASQVVTHLGAWLGPHDTGVAAYADLGKLRREQGIPLHESVREILTLKRTVVDFVRDHAFSNTRIDLFAEEELEHMIHGCFDRILYHFVRGYEMSVPEEWVARAG